MKSLTNNNIIMCGHNSKAFDCVHFINALVLIKVHITEFHSYFCRYPAFLWTFDRQIMPERKQIKTSVQSGSAVP